jgi:Ni,Fe-hydrogenase III large subunit/Ni,Fe-hydrogenase III component G
MIEEKVQQYISKKIKPDIHGNVASFEVSVSEIVQISEELYNRGLLSLKMITATDNREKESCFKVWYIFGVPKENFFIVPYIRLKNTEEFPSITSVTHEAWNYEKKIKTFFGLKPTGHPDNRSLILHENWPEDVFPMRKDFQWNTRPGLAHGTYNFKKVKGEGIYEIPVGPIHAGIIEPGHFRFSVAGERIMLLEPRLGYTHKGSEKLFEKLSLDDKIRLSEKISGDSSFSHSLTFCQALEQLSDISVPKRALYLRVIYAELERLANHFGDIGAIMMDTGFSFGGSNGSRLREMVIQINEKITGSRFLRGVNVVGGVVKDIGSKENKMLVDQLINIRKDFSEVVEIAENSVSLLNRLKGTGVLSYEVAKNHGVVGVVGRAVGIANDTRVDYPYAAYNQIPVGEIITEQSGDVYARFLVRVKEAFASIEIIKNALINLPEGNINSNKSNIVFRKNSCAVSVIEGWRGEIIYFIETDLDGKINRIDLRDPSFVNWSLLKDVGSNNIVPDFPLINKSFNMSYSGNDL